MDCNIEGGGEATAASLYSGRKAITFNPAYLSDATLKKWGWNRGNANVENYVAVGDELAKYQQAVGMKPIGITIDVDTDYPFKRVGPYHPIKKFQKKLVTKEERDKLKQFSLYPVL